MTNQYAFLKSIEASFPVVKSLATGSKRPFDFGFKTSSETAKVVIPKIVNPIALSNPFEKLSTATNGNDNDRTTEATAPVPKEPRPEPFYVKAHNWRHVADEIDNLAQCKVYKKVQDNLIKFFPNTVEIYRKIQNYLSEKKIEFFGMKLKNERTRKVLIKGIPIDFGIEDIKGELSALG